MDEKQVKRTVPPALKALLDVDVALTNQFCSILENFMTFRSVRSHYMVLEISCHGLVWFAGWLAFIWIANDPSLYQMQVNLYLGLILDVVILVVMKSVVRRRRPSQNKPDMFATMGPDVYSFPSGHATRSTFIATFFIYLVPAPVLIQLPLMAWCASVSISRILLRRHHLLDVIVGVFVGFLETSLVSVLWVGQEGCSNIVNFLS